MYGYRLSITSRIPRTTQLSRPSWKSRISDHQAITDTTASCHRGHHEYQSSMGFRILRRTVTRAIIDITIRMAITVKWISQSSRSSRISQYQSHHALHIHKRNHNLKATIHTIMVLMETFQTSRIWQYPGHHVNHIPVLPIPRTKRYPKSRLFQQSSKLTKASRTS